jgi:lipopolysaccharide export LptBFGC system permease protein LptF
MTRLSRTLFWYIFKDLLKIFLMTSGALAGIMSFGGLLRPLTQNGLDGKQVLLLLANFMPAMSTYSLPVAALFATTMVYGRMSADNEVTACRASGIDFISLTLPALILGFVVAGASMYLLCFTVPRATLEAEQVLYSNLAKVIAHEIQQTHRMEMPEAGTDRKTSVFARSAYLPKASESDDPRQQAVVLQSPLIVQYVAPPGKPKWYQQAKDFWSSSTAVARIVEDPDDGSATLTVTLTDGVVFPRSVGTGQATAGAAATAAFGPISIPSRVGEKTKFLDVFKLKALQRDPSRGQQVQQVLQQFIRSDQAGAVQALVADGLRGPSHRVELASSEGATNVLTLPPGGTAAPAPRDDGVLLLSAPAGGPPVQYRKESDGQVRFTAEGRGCRLRFTVAAAQSTAATVSVHMQDAVVDPADLPGDEPDTPAAAPVDQRFDVPLSPEIAAMSDRTADQYLSQKVGTKDGQRKLRFAWFDLTNHISSELHARAAFVTSCLLLVLVGSSLGMMFRSGNFLTAFAVSVAPAMLSTVLIVTGQHTAESTPDFVTAANNPLHLGLAVIWSGNVVIAIAASVLLVRLQRR